MMTIKQLEYFSAVAKLLSFSKAAEQLYISQSALSRSIVSLEQEMNTVLFDRDRHKVTLTPSGMVLMTRLPKLSIELTEIIAEAQQAHVGLLGSMRLAIQNGLSMPDPLYETVLELCRPDAALDIMPVCLDPEDVQASLGESKVDMVYTCEDLVPAGLYCETMELLSDKACIAYNDQKFDFSSADSVLLDFRNINFIQCGTESSVSVQRFKNLCLASGFYPKITQVKDSATQFFCIEMGIGIGVFPSRHKIFEHPRVGRILLTDVPAFHCCLQWPVNSINPAVGFFMDAIRTKREMRTDPNRNQI